MNKGIDAFHGERVRQIQQEGYAPADDVGRSDQLIRAAACYADYAASQLEGIDADEPHPFWPWSAECWKPGNTHLRTLEKAGALLAAGYDALYEELLHG